MDNDDENYSPSDVTQPKAVFAHEAVEINRSTEDNALANVPCAYYI